MTTRATGNALFERIVEASGLSSVFARRSIARALERENLTPDSLSVEDLPRVLPQIRRALEVFIGHQSEVESRIRQISKLH